MPDKPKVGFYWCASCGGCEESIVDLEKGRIALFVLKLKHREAANPFRWLQQINRIGVRNNYFVGDFPFFINARNRAASLDSVPIYRDQVMTIELAKLSPK